MIPDNIMNWIGSREEPSISRRTFLKVNPANGKMLCEVARSNKEDIKRAVTKAKIAQPDWAVITPVERGLFLYALVKGIEQHRDEIAEIIFLETGKSIKEAKSEVGAAVQCGLFFAGEGQRLYGRTTTSGVPNRMAMTIRQPIGVAGLIIAANTPIANIAWKIFPALICGNSVILKAAEDTPATAWIVGKIANDIGIPDGVFNIVQGYGTEAGQPLVENPDVGVVSFTGSSNVGKIIQDIVGRRLGRVSLELGGKNALLICDDANLENAVKWAISSAFSNAGQRCASASRIIIFDSVYETFKEMFIKSTIKLKVGTDDEDDFGPIINEKQLLNMIAAVEEARKEGSSILSGGRRLTDGKHKDGFYMAPTIIEGAAPGANISRQELFGPITCLYNVKNYEEGILLTNDSPYGLIASIHTNSIHRAQDFINRAEVGVISVNGGTHGSEPHMPFGGLKLSGNGTREPGTEALDIYSCLKDVYMINDPGAI